jgi:hypothetical protein
VTVGVDDAVGVLVCVGVLVAVGVCVAVGVVVGDGVLVGLGKPAAACSAGVSPQAVSIDAIIRILINKAFL